MTALSAILFIVGLLLMMAEGDTLSVQVAANVSGLALFAVSMGLMNAQKAFPREYPGDRR
jgi:membrane-bound ClpP family serine protease